jgi:hypothetical protein
VPRFILGLALCCVALMAAGASAKAAGNELSSCLDPSTAIEAGGNVSDKELAAAQSACAHLKQSTQDPKILGRINAAAANLAAEAQRRQSKH